MAERWRCEDVKRMLVNKHVVIIGDSIQRGFYKDLVCLLQHDQYVERSVLRSKGTKTCQDDELIEGGIYGEMHNGKNYREVRHYQTGHHMVSYYMVTSCYSEYMETILEDMMIWDHKPDIVTMASCVWDMTRYGPMSRTRYQKNLQHLAKRLKLALGEDTLFVWNTATPVSQQVRGGFMLEEINFRNETLRYDIVEANFYAKLVMVDHGYNVMDLHYHFRNFLYLREKDGIHWDPVGHRKMTNLILDHFAGAINFPLPRAMWNNNIMSNRVPRPRNQCHKCDKTFQSATALGQHQADSHQMVRSHTVGEFRSCTTTLCSHCNTGFTSHTALMQHVGAKHGANSEDKIYPCPQCRAIMFDHIEFGLHMRRVHPNPAISSQQDNSSRDGYLSEEEVDRDSASSRSSSRCSSHSSQINDDILSGGMDGNLSSHTTSNSTWKIPLKSSPEFPCEECGMGFTSWALLTQHELLTQHRSLLSGRDETISSTCYTCDHCDVDFTSQQQLFNHRTSIRTGHECSFCSHFFLTRQILEQHQRDAHPERRQRPDSGKKFSCECGMSYYKQTSLDGHKNIKCGCGVRVCNRKADKHATRCSKFAKKHGRLSFIPEKRGATGSRSDSIDKKRRTH